MDFTVPLVMGADGKPIGLFSIYTSEGPVVIIFQDSSRWELFATAVIPLLKRKGQRLGEAHFEANSMAEIVAKTFSDPTLANHKFVSDSDKSFAAFVSFLHGT